MVQSVSCPTAEMSGMVLAATARATISSLKPQRSSRLPPPRATMMQVRPRHRGSDDQPVEAVDGGGDLDGAGLALHPHRPDQHMAGEAVGEPVQDVADHRTGRRGDHADDARQIRQRQLAIRVEQALGGERAFALLEQRHQRADAGRLEIVDDDLIFRFVGIGGDASLDHHFEPLLGLELEPLIRALPDHRLDRGLLVLQHEIAMARGVLAPEAGDLAAQPHQPIGLLDGALEREGELRDAIFDEVRRRLALRYGRLSTSRFHFACCPSVLGRQPLSAGALPH